MLWSPAGTATVLADPGGTGFECASAINLYGQSVGYTFSPFLLGAGVGKSLAGQIRTAERVVEFAVRKQPGVSEERPERRN